SFTTKLQGSLSPGAHAESRRMAVVSETNVGKSTISTVDQNGSPATACLLTVSAPETVFISGAVGATTPAVVLVTSNQWMVPRLATTTGGVTASISPARIAESS